MGPSVVLPNNEVISSTQKGQIPLTSLLSKQARTASILPKLESSSLISLGQICDDGCTILLDDKRLTAFKADEIVLQGIRNPHDKLWDIPVTKSTISPVNYALPSIHPSMYKSRMPHKINITTSTKGRSVGQSKVLLDEMKRYNEIIDHNILDNYIAQNETDKKYFVDTPIDATRPSLAVIIRKKQTHTELAQYLHSAAFSPITSTFTQSIQRNFFKTWPGLTPTIIKKHLPPVLATTQGHLHQERQNLQSTNKAKVEHRKQMEKIKKRITELQKKQGRQLPTHLRMKWTKIIFHHHQRQMSKPTMCAMLSTIKMKSALHIRI